MYSPFRHRSVIDQNGEYICAENIDVLEGLIDFDQGLQNVPPSRKTLKKSFYSEEVYNGYCEGNVENGMDDPHFRVFDCDFDDEGNLEGVIFNPHSTYDKESFHEGNWDELVERCNFSPAWAAWYASSEFLPPLD